MVAFMMLKLHMAFAGESDTKGNRCKEGVIPETRNLTEKSSKDSQSNTSELSVSKSYELKSAVPWKGEYTTIIKQFQRCSVDLWEI